MDTASKSNKGFADEDEDDESDFGKRDEPSRKDRKGSGAGSGSDQKATTPRSKHSATEQRRRSKINDRFQILRDLIPHSDQKRDKASFLLEVIEYIQFLQEKVQKYESSYPGWNQDNAKLMPWKNSQGTGESLIDHSQVIKNGPAPAGFVFSGDNTIPCPTMLTNTQSLVECDNANANAGFASKVGPMPVPVQQYVSVGEGCGLAQPHQRLASDPENTASQAQPHWPTDCTITSNTLNEPEELTIKDGTISVSSIYSQGLLTAITQSLQSSGIDLSQATISVQINLGKRAIGRPICSAKDHDDPLCSNQAAGDPRGGSSGEESEPAKKRRK